MPILSSPVRSTALVAGLGMALLVILVHQKIMGYDEEGCSAPRWTTLNEHDDGLTLRQRSGRCKLKLDLRGDLRWNDSEDGIAWIERSGRLDVENRTADAHHELKVRGTAGRGTADGGAPEVEYWRDGKKLALDADARAWLHEIAMVMFRRLGVDAEERSRRILDQRGVDGLVDEIEEIASDRVATLYARAAFDAPTAERTEALAETLRAVARHVGSDHSVAELLVDLAASGLPPDSAAGHSAAAEAATEAATPETGGAETDPSSARFEHALRDALASVGSDYDLRRSCVALLEAGAGPALTESLLRAAGHGIGSDYDAAELVAAYAEELRDGEALSRGALGLLHTIGSDYEMRRSLVSLMQTSRTEDDLRQLLAIAQRVGSDYDLAEILVTMSRQDEAATVEDAFRSTLQLIGSEYERKRAEEPLGTSDEHVSR